MKGTDKVMKIYDLSQPIYNGMNIFEGDPPVNLTMLPASSDGFRVSRIEAGSHTGTHVDAPLHKISGGKTLSELPLSAFMGKGTSVSIPPDKDGKIPLSEISRAISAAKALIGSFNVLLIRTGLEGYDRLPVFESGTAALLKENGISVLGLDSPSMLPSGMMHTELLAGEIIIAEGLRNLDTLPESFFFSAAPLSLEGGDGSPVRAYAVDFTK